MTVLSTCSLVNLNVNTGIVKFSKEMNAKTGYTEDANYIIFRFGVQGVPFSDSNTCHAAFASLSLVETIASVFACVHSSSSSSMLRRLPHFLRKSILPFRRIFSIISSSLSRISLLLLIILLTLVLLASRTATLICFEVYPADSKRLCRSRAGNAKCR